VIVTRPLTTITAALTIVLASLAALGPKTAAFATTPSFSTPYSVVIAGGNLWVTNPASNSVTQVRQSSGTVVKIFSSRAYHFFYPESIVTNGSSIFVLSSLPGRVTQMNAATGKLIRVFANRSFKMVGFDNIAAGGAYLWVAGQFTINQFNIKTGKLIRAIPSKNYGAFSNIVATPTDVYATANTATSPQVSGSVYDFSATTGRLLHTIAYLPEGFWGVSKITLQGSTIYAVNNPSPNPNYVPGTTLPQFATITKIDTSTDTVVATEDLAPSSGFFGIAADSSNLWIGQFGTNTLWSAATSLSNPPVSYAVGGSLNHPIALADDGTNLWVLNQGSSTLVELNAATGALITTIS
jgi:hypothetical protein